MKWFLALIITGAIGIGIWSQVPKEEERTLPFNFLNNIGENENVGLLRKLNAEWTMPDEYAHEVLKVNGITMEWVQAKGDKPDKAVLQLHGGAYNRSLAVNGATYRRAAVKYAEISGAGVLTVDYRVAPEHPYPAALEDALLACNWLLEKGYEPEDIVVAGDSAGGGLTLATALYLRDHDMPMPAALITMSAWTNLDYKRWEPPYVGDERADHPYISPVYGEYDGFPPMLMQVGGDEALLNDTLRVAKKAKEAGVDVTQTTYDGMFHVFQMLFPALEEANEAWKEVGEFIDKIFSS
jgi:acetyl esterase/lipase